MMRLGGMMNMKKSFGSEHGSAIVLALLALGLAAVIVAPVLAHISTSHRATQEAERLLQAQYASDAGAEYALWRLGYDEAFRNQLEAGQVVELEDVPEEAQVRLVQVGEGEVNVCDWDPLSPWIIWAHGQDGGRVLFEGGGKVIYGGIHSNGELDFRGDEHRVYGPGEYVTDISNDARSSFQPPYEAVQVEPSSEWPIWWDIEDFRTGDSWPEGYYHRHEGDWNYSGSGDELPEGIHYVTGDVHISGSGLYGRITIVAEGQIQLSASGTDFAPYVAGLSFFSYQQGGEGIVITGHGNKGGSLFAPRSDIHISGSGHPIRGVLVAQSVRIDGDSVEVGLPCRRVNCVYYDIESTAANVVTTARVRYCGGDWEVLSWTLD